MTPYHAYPERGPDRISSLLELTPGAELVKNCHLLMVLIKELFGKINTGNFCWLNDDGIDVSTQGNRDFLESTFDNAC